MEPKFDEEHFLEDKPAKILQEVNWCDDCQQVVEDGDQEPGYECGNCGTVFSRSNSYSGDNHQCPDCLKFASKLSDDCCPDCGAELETKDMIQVGDEWMTEEDFDAEYCTDAETPPEQGM